MRLLRNFGIIAASKAGGAIEPGLIVEWYGTAATVPEGWALCNGQNGTPDLRNRFVVGTGSLYSVGATGGSADAIVPLHSHTSSNTNTVGNHTHNITVGRPISAEYNRYAGFVTLVGTAETNLGGSHSHSSTVATAGSSGTNANLPPYRGLFYIMKGAN
jgi:microcystin-dependent protein